MPNISCLSKQKSWLGAKSTRPTNMSAQSKPHSTVSPMPLCVTLRMMLGECMDASGNLDKDKIPVPTIFTGAQSQITDLALKIALLASSCRLLSAKRSASSSWVGPLLRCGLGSAGGAGASRLAPTCCGGSLTDRLCTDSLLRSCLECSGAWAVLLVPWWCRAVSTGS